MYVPFQSLRFIEIVHMHGGQRLGWDVQLDQDARFPGFGLVGLAEAR